MSVYQIPPPAPMSLKGEVTENWEESESAWNDYCTATGLDQKLRTEEGEEDPAGQLVVAATLCSVIGTEYRKILNNLLELTAEAWKKTNAIIKALRTYFLPQRNVLYERFLFNCCTKSR